VNIGPEKATGAGGQRPAICALADGRVVVTFDRAMKSIGAVSETPTGGFSVKTIATSSKVSGPGLFNASRLYVTSVATDGTDWVCAWRCGIKEWGSESVYGPAVANSWAGREDAPKSIAFCKGAARIAYDPIRCTYFVLSKDGACLEITGRLNVVGRADMSLGSSGEKLAFAIGPDGRRHAVMSGYSKQGSSYIATGGKRVEWAAYASYPDMSPDENYPGIALYNRNKAMACAVYGGQLRYNIIKNGVCQKSPSNLPSMGTATQGNRIGPAAVKSVCGVRVFWQAGPSVVMGQVGKAAQVICGGSEPTACWNAARDCISLAYVRGGLICIREIREG
jgi:hypothetical protein